MKSRFAKKRSGFKANKIFTDRMEPRAVFESAVDHIADADNDAKEIIVFYGKGGIGKTSLLKELLHVHSNQVFAKYPDRRFKNIYLSLEAYDYSNPVNILTSIRSNISGDGSLYDYALLQYYGKTQVAIEEIKTKNSFLSSPVVDLLNEAIGICTASASIPKALIEKGIGFIRDARFRSKYREEINEIEKLNEFEIFERLPYYLGLCIENAAQMGMAHVLYLDSYESLQLRTGNQFASVDPMDWLKELFLASERMLMVIASRDRLQWEREDEEWSNFLNQHLLLNLSDADCRWFLERVPIQDAEGRLRNDIIEEIIHRSGGVPLYLDLCVDLYEDSINNQTEIDFSKLKGKSMIIDRYMRHLREKDKYAIRVLSVLKSFDYDFAIRLLNKQNLSYHMEEFYSLLEKSIFVPLDTSGHWWKVDESVRTQLAGKMQLQWRIALLEDLVDCILENRDKNLYNYLSVAITMAIVYPECLATLNEKLIEVVEHYASIGYWNELRLLLSDHIDDESGIVRTLAVFVELICLRRTGKLSQAGVFAEKYVLTKEDMGVWYYLYRFLRIHIMHLQGHYDQSMLDYRGLLDEMNLVRKHVPVHVYSAVAIKYADLLFLKGNFDESMSMVNQMLEEEMLPVEDVIELNRIKGHIYRFNRRYAEANVIYHSALELALQGRLKAFEGKLYTNLAEANCISAPQEALCWYEKAMEINMLVGNEIEVGKAQAAGAVAMTCLGRDAEGLALAHKAILGAEFTGYRSGIAFGLAALAYAEQSVGNAEGMDKALEQMRGIIDEIAVYRYILPEVDVKECGQ